jgi:nucleoside-diphosphate-sugar epimerase
MSGPIAFVAGGTGALGGRIVRRLIAAGYSVHASGRNVAKLESLRLLGVTPYAAAMLPDIKCDIIINAAGIGGGTFDSALLHDANIAVLDPLIALGKANPASLLIQLSTPATQFRFEDRFDISEDDAFSVPISPYAFSKQQAEGKLRAEGDIKWCILRLRAGYGAGNRSFVEQIKSRILKGQLLPLINGGVAQIDLVHADDIADAVLAICENPSAAAGMTANIAGPEGLSFRKIAASLAEALGTEPHFLALPKFPVLFAAAMLDKGWRAMSLKSEPPLTRHMAGALAYSQTLDLACINAVTGWAPKRRFADWVIENVKPI